MSWPQSASPPKKFYEILGIGGTILTSETKSALVQASKICVRSALSHKTELDDELTAKAKIECQAFARDGGSVTVSIYPRKPSDEKSDWDDH